MATSGAERARRAVENVVVFGDQSVTRSADMITKMTSPVGIPALRMGMLRGIPFAGDSSPISSLYTHIEKKSEQESTVPLDFYGNMTLGLTAMIDVWLWNVGGKQYKKVRQDIFNGIFSGMIDKKGTIQYEQFMVARSKLGPYILGILNNLVIEEGLPIISDINPLALFEHKGIPKEHKVAQYWKDGLMGVIAGLAAWGVDAGILSQLPSHVQDVLNPALVEDVAKGTGIGAAVATLPGVFVRGASSDKSLGNKLAAGLVLTTAGAGATIAGVVSKEDAMISQEVSPANFTEQGWTAPALGLVAFGLVGLSKMLGHKKGYQAIEKMMSDIQSKPDQANGWRNMLAIIVDALDYQQRLTALFRAETKGYIQDRNRTNVFFNNIGVSKELREAVINMRNRDASSISAFKEMTPHRLGELSEFLMQVEMMGWEMRPSKTITFDGKPVKNVDGIVQKPLALFENLSLDMLGLVRGTTTTLVKSLKEKDPVAGLSIIFPSVSMLALGAAITPGQEDDGIFYGDAHLNMSTSGMFVIPAVRAMQDATVSFTSDTLRGSLWNIENIKQLASSYKMSMPIGGLDRINRPPVQTTLMQLYSFAHVLSAETSGQVHGSKGLISDVGESIIKSMSVNPLFGYIALADLSTAIKWAPTLLNALPNEKADEITRALRQLRQTVVRKILDIHLPIDKSSARKLLTDENFAVKGYTALEMLVESCGDDAVQEAFGNRMDQIFAVSGAAGDPLIYTEILPVWIFNLRRQGSKSPYLSEVVLKQVSDSVRSIALEYVQRIGVINPTPIAAEDSQSIYNYLYLSIISGSFDAGALEELEKTIETSLNSWNTAFMTRFSPFMSSLKGEVPAQVASDYNRLSILVSFATFLSEQRNATRFASSIQELGTKMQSIATQMHSVKM